MKGRSHPDARCAGAEVGGSVCAVVVTYRRLDLLRECLSALHAQTRPVQHVLVVDNASQDRTVGAIRAEFPDVEVCELSTNEGGAGGFHEGMRLGYEHGFAWLWLLDDDTIAAPDTLERLLDPLERLDGLPEPRILASKVVWTDGQLHPKNLPWARSDGRFLETFVAAADHGLLLIRNASFVSILVNRAAVHEHGLPHRHYFIWGDDGEYTARVLRDHAGYLVPASVVLHKTTRKEPVHGDRTARAQYYYEVRNKIFMLRGGAWTGREKVRLASATILGTWLWLREARFHPSSFLVLLRAVRDGLLQAAE